jgi:Uncharacterized conserved protein
VLAPFTYSQLVWVSVLGFVMFAEIPDRFTVLGACIIISSGLYIAHRERIRKTTNARHAGTRAGRVSGVLRRIVVINSVRIWDVRYEIISGARSDGETTSVVLKKYIAEIPAFIAKHSGRYLVQGTEPTTIEGDWRPKRMVILEFPERGNAEAFLGDPEIQSLFKIRHDTTTSKLVLVDGCT